MLFWLPAVLVAAWMWTAPPANAAPTAAPHKLELTSDTLTVRPGARRALAEGHVVATSQDAVLRCDSAEGTYSSSGGRTILIRLDLRGGVHVKRLSDGLVAEGREATWTQVDHRVVLRGDPVITRGEQVIRGETLFVGLSDRSFEADQARVFWPQANGEPLEVTGKRLFVEQNGTRIRVEGDVHIIRGTLQAKADHAVAHLASGADGEPGNVSNVVLTGAVDARREGRRATAGKATYEARTGDLVLEERPQVFDAQARIRGERIVLDGRTGAARVEKPVARMKVKP